MKHVTGSQVNSNSSRGGGGGQQVNNAEFRNGEIRSLEENDTEETKRLKTVAASEKEDGSRDGNRV
jgi:hypothetical protein